MRRKGFQRQIENLAIHFNKYFKKIWKEYETEVKKSGYLVSIIINFLLLFFFNNLIKWNIPYITSEFNIILPLLNLSLISTIIVNTMFIINDSVLIHKILCLEVKIISIVFLYYLYNVFPFDFTMFQDAEIIESLLLLAITFGILFTAISVILEFVKLLFHPLSQK